MGFGTGSFDGSAALVVTLGFGVGEEAAVARAALGKLSISTRAEGYLSPPEVRAEGVQDLIN